VLGSNAVSMDNCLCPIFAIPVCCPDRAQFTGHEINLKLSEADAT
jgi:hypothetical protein